MARNSKQLILFFTFNIKLEWAGDDITVRCPNTFVFSCILCVGSHNCQAENHKYYLYAINTKK